MQMRLVSGSGFEFRRGYEIHCAYTTAMLYPEQCAFERCSACACHLTCTYRYGMLYQTPSATDLDYASRSQSA